MKFLKIFFLFSLISLVGCKETEYRDVPGKTVFVPGETVTETVEVEKPEPRFTQVTSSCELNKECEQLKVVVYDNTKSFTLTLPDNVNARLKIDGGFREPIVDGNLITFNVSDFTSPEMVLYISSSSEEGGNISLHSYEYANAEEELTTQVVENSNAWYVDFYHVRVIELTLNLYGTNGKEIQSEQANYLLTGENTDKMYLSSISAYARNQYGETYRFINSIDGNVIKILLPKGQYDITVNAGWSDGINYVGYLNSFTYVAQDDKSDQMDVKLHPGIYSESLWQSLKDDYNGSIHRENVFDHYVGCTIGNKINDNRYIVKEQSVYIDLSVFCVGEFNPEIESVTVVASQDGVLETPTGPVVISADEIRFIQLNSRIRDINLRFTSDVVGEMSFEVLSMEYSDFGVLSEVTMGDKILRNYSIMEKGEIIPQVETQSESFKIIGESVSLGSLCINTKLDPQDFVLTIGNQQMLKYSNNNGDNEHCYHLKPEFSDYGFSYINFDYDLLNGKSDEIKVTSLLVIGNDSGQNIIWEAQE